MTAAHQIVDIDDDATWPGPVLSRLLTSELVEDKISDAYACGLISAAERDRCDEENIYAIHAAADVRVGSVSRSAGRSSIAHADGLTPFLGGWGGETINGGPGPGEDPVLRRLGGGDVLDIWRPGDPGYDRHPALPRGRTY
jgi:hypothetical protein